MSWRALSPRQEQIVDLIAGEGLDYRQAAERLGISPLTLRNHVQRIGTLMDMSPRKAIAEYFRTRTLPPAPHREPPPPIQIDDGRDQHDNAEPVGLGGVTLTKRQLQVLELVAQGMRYRDIGKRLGITEKTVSVHVQAIGAAIGREASASPLGARHFVAQWYQSVVVGARPRGSGTSVYFVQARNGLIKIGVSDDPASRLAQLQAASPVDLRLLGTCEGDRHVEARLHARYWDHLVRGEWFEPSEQLLAEIAKLTGVNAAA